MSLSKLLIALLLPMACSPCYASPALIMRNSSLRATQAKAMHKLIMNSSIKHKIDPALLTAVVAVESNFKPNAVNKHTHDYGLAQINANTIVAMKLDSARILEPEYNLNAAAKLLAWLQRTYAKKEPQSWYCRYNVGTAKLEAPLTRDVASVNVKNRLYAACMLYKAKIDSVK